MLALAPLLLILPLAGFLANGLLGRRLPRGAVAAVGAGSIGLAFALALILLVTMLGLPAGQRVAEIDLFTWIQAGDLRLDAGLLLDPLSVTMTLVVTGVGFLIHVYSIGYMREDPGFARFFAYLNLFTFAMLVLVLADSWPLLFVGWEGVGLCSYLLIGFWFEEKINADAGKKAFIVNRVGDFAFLLGMFLIFRELGTLEFRPAFAAAPRVLEADGAAASWIALLLFVGATGKSAQLPLHVWLPDAMQGPTPVSALIHAATMVTAGVYVIARSHVLYLLAPEVLLVVAIVGAATALFAATIGTAQTDIKRVLAYSTISQLGYMFLAVGVAAFTAGIFHLVTHAFFKALLFLAAGSVIHALHHEQDLRRMGGLRSRLPVTAATALVATLAIAGIPPLAGFFSKDEILWSAWSAGERALWGIGFVTALLTAFYMWRWLALAFYGAPRDRHVHEHAHEPPAVMTVPLVILAVLSVVGGWIGIPHVLGDSLGHLPHLLDGWLEPVFADAEELRPAAAEAVEAAGEAALELALMAASVAAALVGIGVAAFLYLRSPARRERWVAAAGPLRRAVENKYWVDEVYHVLFVGPYLALSMFLWRIVDVLLIDGFVVRAVGGAVAWYGRLTRGLQTGLVQNYAAVLFVGVVVLLGWYLFR